VSPKPPPPGDDSPPADDPFASYDPLADRDGQVLEFDEFPRNRIDAAGAAASHADHTPQEHAYFRPSEAIPEGFDLLAGTPFAQEEPELEPEKEPELEPDRPVSPAPPAPTSEPEPAPREAPEPTLDRHPEAAEAVEVDEPKPFSSTGAGRAATSVQGELLEAFLSGLGSAGAAPAPGEELEYMRTCGALLRALTEGLMAVMRARTSFKSELRIEMTTIRSVENNPFKFSVSADDALAKLLLRNTRGYLPPVDAANEALDDVQAHEMAMIAGLRAALRALLARFDPNELEQRFKGESVLDNLLPVAKKGKCWDRFTEVYSEVAADTADDFLHLFGGAFIRAYENQVALLKEGRRRGGT
jgi:type VI secretion system FHA domain protein